MRTTPNYKTTTSVSFGRTGILNPEAIDFFKEKDLHTLVIFSDGSEEAFEHIRAYDFTSVVGNASRLAAARLPLWDMRVVNPNGDLSLPNYLYSDANKIDWFCSEICAPLTSINVSDTSSPSGTKVALERRQVEQMCDMSFRFWMMLKAAEDRLCFPALVIDALTRWTRHLEPQLIDIPSLRKETGLKTLDYQPLTDLLSIAIAGETFTVKLSVLDALLKNHILPFFNKYQGRRYQMEVSILGLMQSYEQMSYGQLGRQIEEMQGLIRSERISHENPMGPEDLIAHSKKVKVDEESCFYGHQAQSIEDFLLSAKPVLVRHTERTAYPLGINDTNPDTSPKQHAA